MAPTAVSQGFLLFLRDVDEPLITRKQTERVTSLSGSKFYFSIVMEENVQESNALILTITSENKIVLRLTKSP